MRIGITGASGFIGSAMVAYLGDRHDVLLLGRDPQALANKFDGRFPTFDYAAAGEALNGVDAVVHLAAALPGTLNTDTGYKAANTDLAVYIGRAASTAKVNIFVNAATLGWNRNAYSASKLAAEKGLASVPNLRVAHIRLPAVYSDEFRGRLSVLNHVPGFLRGGGFKVLASLRPTVSMERVCYAFEEAIMRGEPGEIIISDRQVGNPVYSIVRALIDYAFAGGVILMFWWLMALIYAAVRLDTRGPGIFAQERVGKHRKIFKCYKFRTMSIGTKIAGTHEISDNAITRVGGFLRRTKLDELPQVVNILRREMSLVGPRPSLLVQAELIEARDSRGVYDVLPGITGLSQIKGIDMSDPQCLARADERYVAERNLVTDVKIIIQTLKGRGQGDRVARGAA
ncbi:sugar transferase [Hoeflea sp. Naph1]|uniref:sugar transferase n=1 Tax=Hoeflea sp. Naph1 TaxID=3388653 RepID=UPI00398FD1F6